jgi:hypothetical protein
MHGQLEHYLEQWKTAWTAGFQTSVPAVLGVLGTFYFLYIHDIMRTDTLKIIKYNI